MAIPMDGPTTGNAWRGPTATGVIRFPQQETCRFDQFTIEQIAGDNVT